MDETERDRLVVTWRGVARASRQQGFANGIAFGASLIVCVYCAIRAVQIGTRDRFELAACLLGLVVFASTGFGIYQRTFRDSE